MSNHKQAMVQARGRLAERGMVTVEYAIGIVMVLVLVGVMIAAIQQGWFGALVQDLIETFMKFIPKALGIG